MKNFIIIVATVLSVAIIGVGVYFIISEINNNQSTDDSSNQTELEKEGYVFNDEVGVYEKPGEKAKEVLVNFTQSSASLKSTYVVKSTITHVVFEGESYKKYTDFSIKIASRTDTVYIELKNFAFQAQKGNVGLDASGVTAMQTVYLIINGNCEIIGGSGTNGGQGTGYSVTAGVNNARSGNSGTDATSGQNGILANTLNISIQEGASLIVTGGNGGNGGGGGNGEGSNGPGKSVAGKGGDGGNGGAGGNALSINNALSITNNGALKFAGGIGGNGGKGGSGGSGTVQYQLDDPDHGGNGGKGGNGGDGGFAIHCKDYSCEITVKGLSVTLVGGNGGNGASGGNGGNSKKTTAYKAGNAGSAGRGGNGGDGSVAIAITSENFDEIGGKGGIGGKSGNAGESNGTYGSSADDGYDGKSYA